MTTDLLVDAGDQLPPEIRLKHLNRILRAVHRFKRILDEVITINRAESGKLFCRTVKVELQPIMEEVVQDCLLAEGRSHRITQSVQGETCPVQVDPDLLRTVLVNLLTNAVKYSNIGTEVLIELRQGSDSYQVVVSDHGIGIPEEDQPRIFLPFERASNVRNIQGTGLGLNIVKRLVELQGGRISFTSRKDHGTTFLVELPTVSNQGTNSNPDSVHSSIVI
ncbi:MAG: HAMP domain-containing sensor histidine kinase [Verrucomicrobiota bacterium]